MAITHTITQKVTTGAGTKQSTRDIIGTGQTSINESIPDSTTDLEVAFVVDVSQALSIWMSATGGNLTVCTNVVSPGTDSIALADGKPQLFTTDTCGGFATLFTVDVTKLFIQNASGAASILDIEYLYDPTV